MKKYTKKEAKNIHNAMLNEMLSPFKVQNWINKNMNIITDYETGLTVGDILKEHGFDKKKIALTDLYQVDNKVCYLERDTSIVISDEIIAGWYGYTKVGKYYYRPVEAANTVESFLKSLDAVNMIREEREKRCAMYAKMFERIEAKRQKEVSKERKSKNKEARTARKKAVKTIIDALKQIPLYATYTDMQIARAALSMYNKAA